jgi:hypothetical protein
VVGHYDNFFIASAGASAAVLGLLVVAVSVVNADDGDPKTRENRTVLQRALVLVIVVLYCSALGRTWEVTGITKRV